MMPLLIDSIFRSICSAVTPSLVPATLKSMSPRWSSEPRMSVRTATFFPSLMSPIATPAQGAASGSGSSCGPIVVPPASG